MHGQVADFMDVLFGEASECPTSGEISFVVPRHREFDQELEDFSDLIETDELSLIPTMDQLLGKVKPVLSNHLKLKPKTAYRLMQIKSIAECPKSILQYFRTA